MTWPTGDACPECGRPMDVGAVGLPGETITWQQCDGCRIGWGPFTGFVDLDRDERLVTDGGRRVDGTVRCYRQLNQRRGGYNRTRNRRISDEQYESKPSPKFVFGRSYRRVNVRGQADDHALGDESTPDKTTGNRLLTRPVDTAKDRSEDGGSP